MKEIYNILLFFFELNIEYKYESIFILVIGIIVARITLYLLIPYSSLSTFRPNLRIRNQYNKILGPSATLRAIGMCLRPAVDNGDNLPRSLVPLGCALGTNLSSEIISLSIFRIFCFQKPQ